MVCIEGFLLLLRNISGVQWQKGTLSPTEGVAEGKGSYLTGRQQIPPPTQFVDDDDS